MKCNFLILTLILSFGAAAIADSPASSAAQEQERIVQFLKEHLLNKPLTLSGTSKIDGGKVETVFSRTLTVTGLIERRQGFEVDFIGIIEQKLYDLDAQGKRTEHVVNKDRTQVIRFSGKQMLSTGEICGSSHGVVSSLPEGNIGGEDALRWKFDGGKLKIHHVTINYTDAFTAGGKYSPAVFESTYVFHVVDGKVELEETNTRYDVDPKTLERKQAHPTKKYVSKEK